MAYYVVNIQETAGETIKGIFEYSYDDALIAYHNTCASNRTAMKAGTLTGYSVALLNSHLHDEMTEFASAPAPEPEPNTED